MPRLRPACLFAALMLLMPLAAQAAPPVRASGSILTDDQGMTLYTFARDAPNVSACTGNCAKMWPPLEARGDEAESGGFSVIRRSDGLRQWAYKGQPLYTWSRDRKPGDMLGDGVNNSWFVARP